LRIGAWGSRRGRGLPHSRAAGGHRRGPEFSPGCRGGERQAGALRMPRRW
jgi:hypothetical protein